MIGLKFICLGIVFHEILSYLIEGELYINQYFMPVFGLYLSRKMFCSLHLCLLLICMLVILFNVGSIYLIIVFIFYILSYPKRLSNHLILVFFFLILLILDNGVTLKGDFNIKNAARLILILLYFFSGFHKLNKGFFSLTNSCLARIAMNYFNKKKLSRKLCYQIVLFSRPAIVIYEFTICFLLAFDSTIYIAIILAVLLHFMFGLIIHIHFSTISYALLLIVSDPSLNQIIDTITNWHNALFIIPVGILFGILFGCWENAKYRSGVKVMMVIFSILSFYVLFIIASKNVGLSVDAFTLNLGEIILLSLILVNNICPYLGLKTSFSFTMFSNLHPIKSNHFFVRRYLWNFPSTNYCKLIDFSDVNGKIFVEKYNYNFDGFLYRNSLRYSSHYIYNSLKHLLVVNGNFIFRIEYNNIIYEVTNLTTLDNIPFGLRKYLALFPALIPINDDSANPICD